jgi:hypothetical protein
MEERKVLEIPISSAYFLDTNAKVEMKIERFCFCSDNSIHVTGNDRNGVFEIKGNMNMNKFILEKHYSANNSVIYLAGLFYSNVIKFIYDFNKNYEDMFAKLSESFFNGEIKTELATLSGPNMTLFLNQNEIEKRESNMKGLLQKNFRFHFVELMENGSSEYNINIYNFDDVDQRKTKVSGKEFDFSD